MSFVDLASPSARLHKPVGDLRPREDSRYLSTPRLWIFPPSINSGKAHVALCASSCTDFTVETVGVVGANYRPEYALLNPLMTVPTLEIDDVIINDSHEIVRYLRKHRPAAGTTDSAEVQSFVALVESWDEGLWNYGTLEGAFPSSNLGRNRSSSLADPAAYDPHRPRLKRRRALQRGAYLLPEKVSRAGCPSQGNRSGAAGAANRL
jgi:glutathione S-transferase